MSGLVSFFIRKPMLVNILIFTGFLFGLNTILKIRKEGFPLLALDEVSIITLYPGASSADVETNVTKKIEAELEGISNIKEIRSESSAGISSIRIVAADELDESQFKTLYDDVGNAINSVQGLPDGAERPTFRRLSSADIGIIEIALAGNLETLRSLTPFIKNSLRKAYGVSHVDAVGFPDEEYHVLVDADLANKNYVDLSQVMNAIQKRNVEGSGGTLESSVGEKKIVAFNKYQSVEDLLETNVRRNFDGEGVKLKNLAKVDLALEDMQLSVKNNRQNGISLVVKKTESADMIKTIDSVKEVMDKIELPVGVSFQYLNDQSEFTRNRISLLLGNALTGGILVLILLSFVFNFKTAFWTSFSIPFSVITAFTLLPLFGLTLNAITLGGVVIVLGMLVDDAIVVAEQINTEKEAGFTGIDAAVSAVLKVWKPIFAASATTVVAYSPLANMGGLPGEFIWAIPVVVALALIVSLFDTYFLLPSHLGGGKVQKTQKKEFILKLEKLYRVILQKTYAFRYLVILSFISLFFVSIYVAKNFVVLEPFPQDAVDTLYVKYKLKPGVSLKESQEVARKAEDVISSLSSEELVGLSSRIGTHNTRNDTDRGSEANLGIIFVYLTDFEKRERKASFILKDLQAKLESAFKNQGVQFIFEEKRQGPPLGYPFELNVLADNHEKRNAEVEKVKNYLRSLPGVYGIEDDQVLGKPELNIRIDNDAVSELGITASDVLRIIKISFDGLIVSDFIEDGKSKNFRLRLNEVGRADIRYIGELGVMNNKGQLVKLNKLLKYEEKESLASIRHLNSVRSTKVYGQLQRDLMTPEKLLNILNEKFKPSTEVDFIISGEPVENAKIFGGIGKAAVIAIISIFLIIMLVLDSAILPFVVMAAIPFGIIGIVFSVWAHGMPISMFVMISMVGLAGILVNDSILVVETIQQLGQLTTIDNIIEGTVARLRPVCLTSITTILGLLPTAYAVGGYDPFISPMCLALAYGLMFGTLVTLIFIPCLYFILQDMTGPKTQV